MKRNMRNCSNSEGQRYVRDTRICPKKKRAECVKNHSTFNCYFNCNPKDTMQGILYKDSSCLIGIDVWRLLNRMDTCQYAYRRFSSIEKANITLVNIPKGYYMEK